MRLIFLILFGMLFLQACKPEKTQPAVPAPAVLQVSEVAALPLEARNTLRLVKQGGPFHYSRDGEVFSNYEHVLPKQARNYYHEYTVKTPGAHNRGVLRIIAGRPGEYYYSADHYKTFKWIRE